MYKSAQTWFDKFEVGEKGYMSKQEWYEQKPWLQETWEDSLTACCYPEAVSELSSGCATEDDGLQQSCEGLFPCN